MKQELRQNENFLRGAHCKIQKFKNKGHPNDHSMPFVSSKGAFRLNAKQPKFDVIDSLRKVATGRNLREQLRNIACLQAVVR